MSKQKVVLCVDDELDILELLQEEFEERDIAVITAQNGNQAITLFEEKDIDCVISDIRMPNGNGIKLVSEIRKKDEKTPIFLMTGYSDHSEIEVNQLNIEALVFKPFDVDELIEMVIDTLKK